MTHEEQVDQLANKLLDRAAFFRGVYGGSKDVERLMDELDVLLAKVDEDTAAKIIQVAYKLARR